MRRPRKTPGCWRESPNNNDNDNDDDNNNNYYYYCYYYYCYYYNNCNKLINVNREFLVKYVLVDLTLVSIKPY